MKYERFENNLRHCLLLVEVEFVEVLAQPGFSTKLGSIIPLYYHLYVNLPMFCPGQVLRPKTMHYVF